MHTSEVIRPTLRMTNILGSEIPIDQRILHSGSGQYLMEVNLFNIAARMYVLQLAIEIPYRNEKGIIYRKVQIE